MVAIWNQKETSEIRSASAPIEIAGENVHVALALSPGTDVPGRLIFPDGAALPRLADAKIMVEPEPGNLRVVNTLFTANADGSFVARNLPWTRNRVSMIAPPAGYYVKEIRYNHALAADRIVTLSGVAPLEIVFDDQPAAITGTVVDGDKPVPGAEVLITGLNPPISSFVRADDEGLFQIRGLAPGEYRIAAFSTESLIQFSGSVDLNRATLRAGEKVSLERGGQQTVQLKPVDPTH
jgi:hypothetical protein